MASHIGIVGVSPEGASLFFRAISRQASQMLPPDEHPTVSLHNESLALYIDAIRKHDWHAVGNLLRRSAEVLARVGAAFAVTPDNAVLHGLHLAQPGSPIPWLTIPEVVASAVAKDGRKHVGLIGTKLVTEASTYQTILGLKGISVHVPPADDCNRLEDIIYGELIYGHARPESQAAVLDIIDSLARDQGCQGVILGCSEAPLLVNAGNCPIPAYDAVDILAEAAIRKAMQPA